WSGFFFSSRRRHTRSKRDWSSDVCSSDLALIALRGGGGGERVHQRPGLAGDLVLEQRGVAPVGARGVDQSQPDDADGQSDEDGEIGRASCREREREGRGGGRVGKESRRQT